LTTCAAWSEGRSQRLLLSARVPDFEVDSILWMKEHYEGGSLFSDLAIVTILPGVSIQAHFRWQSQAAGIPDPQLRLMNIDGEKFELHIPFESR
jgi:hypothetical protein